MAANGTYEALTEFLCWEVPILGFDYVEVRISTRWPSPPDSYLDDLEARAKALGVQWSGSLTQVCACERARVCVLCVCIKFCV